MDMKCDGCVNAVKNKLATVDGGYEHLKYVLYQIEYDFDCRLFGLGFSIQCELIYCFLGNTLGVKNVDVDLSNQVVRILGSSPVKTMTEALEQTGRKARLIGQGILEGWSLFFFPPFFVSE